MKKLHHGIVMASILAMTGSTALKVRTVPEEKPCRRKLCTKLTSHKKGYCSPECLRGEI